MRNFLTAMDMCLHTFTAIPLPRGRWDDSLKRLATEVLPLVGLILGAIWWGIAALARFLPPYLAGAVIAAVPFLLTGFIHLDGFMDASDALLSWRGREEKLRILKDSRVGAFAVISVGLLMLFQFAAAMSVEKTSLLLWIPMLSRAGSAVCVCVIPPLETSQYAADKREMPKTALLCGGLALLAMIVFAGWRGLIVGAAVVAGYAAAMRCCVRALGGVSGDLAGFSMTIAELCGLIALAIV